MTGEFVALMNDIATILDRLNRAQMDHFGTHPDRISDFHLRGASRVLRALKAAESEAVSAFGHMGRKVT